MTEYIFSERATHEAGFHEVYNTEIAPFSGGWRQSAKWQWAKPAKR
ncbi:MAG: hypothetical protein ACRBB0_13905 [Pelagimonas sp.]